MKGSRKRRVWMYFVPVILLVVVSGLVYGYLVNVPPSGDVIRARETLATVKQELKGKYAVEMLGEAEDLFTQAMEEWELQNDKFFLVRNYDRVEELAAKSCAVAEQARKEAGKVKAKLTQNIERELDQAWKIIERFENNYKHLPLNRSTLDHFHRGKIKYYEALHEYERADIKQALKIIAKASENLSQADKAARYKLMDFYESFPEWEKNHKMAYALSKKGQTVILVNKMEATCYILKSGKIHRSFQAEFGPNWMGDKMKSGDKATPEGIYKVVDKKNGRRTKYHKALLLDYPNAADKARFNQLVKSGKIAKNSRIGGLIEIHGHGSKGINWTDGCVALDNKDMDAVFEACSVNTPVIIIGSHEPLANHLN